METTITKQNGWKSMKCIHLYLFSIIIMIMLLLAGCNHDDNARTDRLLNDGWMSVMDDSLQMLTEEICSPDFSDAGWIPVNVPHNWDDYYGYRRLMHGNLHGTAWYRKPFYLEKGGENQRYFIRFEGVGSYATVWLNGKKQGYHAGGRTSFTVDVTDDVLLGDENILVVRADHPENIRDLPWICGGCSPEWGFSEGSQPLGIFRPVHLITTGEIRVEPFGIHIWNNEGAGYIYFDSEIKNYSGQDQSILLVSRIVDCDGKSKIKTDTAVHLGAGESVSIHQQIETFDDPRLWSPEDPYLYRLVSEIRSGNTITDRITTSFGIRWIKWDIAGDSATKRFYLNGEPYFINGNAEYEHLLGQSHAFSDRQVKARVEQFREAGFNAFRDAHQPHNLRYQHFWDSLGLFWWPQMAAHIWFDTPEFRDNFLNLLEDWVRERRNSPSIILWGLENESTLPEDFARQCTDLIRELDPTASVQRKITTCNGGTGTDWNVIQNWSGTYGGDPEQYGEELKRQVLNGEYGAWRSLGLHTEGGFVQDGPFSEDRFCLLMESKIRLAESVSDQCAGQFHWLFASHDNPGRIQGGEGLRDLDRPGPVNYKGLFTIWGEPTDGYYLYRANYAPKESEPMIYIVSHTWEDRWLQTGLKDGITVFSNCDEVELFNGGRSLGRQANPGRGHHFVWDNAEISENLLVAKGFVNAKITAEDCIVLNHLPQAENLYDMTGEDEQVIKPVKGRNYIYRVNCGGPDYSDSFGNLWVADRALKGSGSWGSISWTDKFENLPPFYTSQRYTTDPIRGTVDWPLFQTYRYGRHYLKYFFPLPDGIYRIELYFVEPWYGTGGGMNCTGWRLFDVALNDSTVIDNLDIWREAGHDHILKKDILCQVTQGNLTISFPEVLSGQAVISAIAVSSEDNTIKAALPSTGLIKKINMPAGYGGDPWEICYWMATGVVHYSDRRDELYELPPELFGAEWIMTPSLPHRSLDNRIVRIIPDRDADFYVGVAGMGSEPLNWMKGFTVTGTTIGSTFRGDTNYEVFKRKYNSSDTILVGPLNPDGKGYDPMFIMAMNPSSDLGSPIDLRETVTYQAEDQPLKGTNRKVILDGRPSVSVSGNMNSLEWEFSVGLASRYGLEFRYMNPTNRIVPAEMRIETPEGVVVWKGDKQFLPSGNRWKSLRTDSGTTINAGRYRIIIIPGGEHDLFFDWLKIQ